MPASVVQVVESDPGTSSTATSVVMATTVGGNSIVVYTASNFVNVSAVTDTQGNSYSLTDTVGTDQQLKRWVANNIVGGANTVSAIWDSATGIRPILAAEIGGVTASPNDGHAGQAQATPTLTTDATTTGTFSNTVQPGLLEALSVRVFQGPPNAGTGFTDLGTKWAISIGSARYESKALSTTGSQAATFTSTNNGLTLTAGGAFKEYVAAASFAPPRRSIPSAFFRM